MLFRRHREHGNTCRVAHPVIIHCCFVSCSFTMYAFVCCSTPAFCCIISLFLNVIGHMRIKFHTVSKFIYYFDGSDCRLLNYMSICVSNIISMPNQISIFVFRSDIVVLLLCMYTCFLHASRFYLTYLMEMLAGSSANNGWEMVHNCNLLT